MNDDNTLRAGNLRVAGAYLAHLLRLPDGHTVRSMRVLPAGELEIEIHGETMPAVTDGRPALVILELTTERTPRAGFRGIYRRTIARWKHRPTRPWVISDWQKEPAA